MSEKNNKDLVIVIPAYEPDSQLTALMESFKRFFQEYNVVIVNDGSKNSDEIFKKCSEYESTVVLNHDENKGKGEALKTAFRYIKKNFKESVIITADSDGQHKPEDIKRIYDFYLKNEKSLVLGSRRFDGDVPKRSTVGNDISRGLIRLCHNRHLNDTQTGLRAFGNELLDFMIKIKGSKYEYEMNMISEAIIHEIPIKEVPIQTVYINQNKSSHFRPVRDFSRITFTILKYAVMFFLFLNIDTVLFAVFMKYLKLPVENPFLYKLSISAVSFAASFFIYSFGSTLNLLYGNRFFLRKAGFVFKKILFMICALVLSSLISAGLLSFMVYAVPVRILTDILILIIYALANYFILRKSQFCE